MIPVAILMFLSDFVNVWFWTNEQRYTTGAQLVAGTTTPNPWEPLYMDKATYKPWSNIMASGKYFFPMAIDWLAICFFGSISLFLGALWLETRILMFSTLCYLVILCSYTPGMIYLSYAQGAVGRIWWYGGLSMV